MLVLCSFASDSSVVVFRFAQGTALAALAYTPLSGAPATGAFLSLPPPASQAPVSLPPARLLGGGAGSAGGASAPPPASADSKQQVGRCCTRIAGRASVVRHLDWRCLRCRLLLMTYINHFLH